MHYDVKYDAERIEDHAKAINDIQEYLEPKQWLALVELSGNAQITEPQLQMYASIAGVSGFPITALWLANNPGARL